MPSITPGKYVGQAIVEDVQFGRHNGKEQIAIPFEIVEGECAGMRWTWFGTFSDKGTEWVVKTLRACGWVGNDLSDLGSLEKNVSLVFDEEEWEGRTSLKLKWVNPIGGGKVKMQDAMSDDERAAFARRMKGVIAGLPADAGGPPPASRAQAASGRQQGTQSSRPAGRQAPPADETFDEVPF